MDIEFVNDWLNKLKEYWFNKDIDKAVALFNKTTFYQETPFMKPYTTIEEINQEWQHVKNENIEKIEIKLLAIDGYTVIAEWILKQNDEEFDGIYEIKFKTDVLDFDTLDMFLQTTTSTDIPGLIYDGTSYYNYLSNVCSFSWLTKVTDGFSIDENCSNIGFSFENDTIRQTTVLVKENMTSLSLFQSNGYYYIYLLFDYDTIKINRIFSYNIGFTGNKIYFKEDVSFIIKM